MYKEFEKILNNYIDLKSQKNYKDIKNIFENTQKHLANIINSNKLSYDLQYGFFSGRYASCPWIMINDKNVTDNPGNGIYIAFLFKADMSGFYLALTQGVEKENEDIEKLTTFYKNNIKTEYFSKNKINLSSNLPRPKGYKQATIIAKYYEKGNFNSKIIEEDLLKISQIYQGLIEKFNLGVINYNDFKSSIFNGQYTNSFISSDNIESKIDETIELIGQNLLYYGVPGSGKSYKANKYADELLGNYNTNKYRVTFYPDYTYADFIGQIIPYIDNNNLSYKFAPGIFTQALKKAYSTKEPVVLIIEEINRGNAPAIFGELFQLLDRKANGESEYSIKNSNIAIELGLPFESNIILPNNLFILATMNTSDQNVFPLDTAFKRRWTMKYVEDISSGKYKKIIIPNLTDNLNGETQKMTWENFHLQVNQIIQTKLLETYNSEDKGIGYYFLKEDEFNSPELFGEKVLQFLWFDVFNLRPSEIFNFSSFRELINTYKNHDLLMYGNDQNALFRESYKPQ